MIGGLFREANTSSRSQVPGLGDLPLVGNLFRNKEDQTQRQEVIIFLTPHGGLEIEGEVERATHAHVLEDRPA